MGIIGDRPDSGIRLTLQRAREGGPPWTYRCEAVTATARFVARAVIGEDGEASVTSLAQVAQADAVSPELAQRIRLVLRAAWKHAKADRAPPPERIVRWRADAT
jgi:hypothetical protein